MFIQTEVTPNPNVLKFIPGHDVLGEGGAHEFRTPDEAEASPLADGIFAIDGVARVFFGSDYLTVAVHPGTEWPQVKAPVLAAIMDHYTSSRPLFFTAPVGGGAVHGDDTVYEGDVAEVVQEIKDLLDQRIRPAVAQDGGDILFSRFEPETGVVWLHMKGACSGCPSSALTLKSGVENMLKHYVPEVTRVEQTL